MRSAYRAQEIDIRPAARQMLADLGHPFSRGEEIYDVTFENVQAGLRTDYLFRLANHNGALVCGTGDLSELGLGWCTYGVGDHMSHYNVNASVAKTLIQHLIRFVATSGEVNEQTAQVLFTILATEISPELVPAGADGADPIDPKNHRSLRASGLQSVLRDAIWIPSVADRVSRFQRVVRCERAATGRLIFRPPIAATIRWTRSSTGSVFFCFGFSQSASSSARRCRMGQKYRREARCRRAAIGAHRPTAMPGSGWRN